MTDATTPTDPAPSGAPGGAAGQWPERQFGSDGLFTSVAEDPRSDGGFSGERATLVGYLRDQRLTLEMKCSGLTDEELARRAVEPSNLSLLGLLRHMADVELSWFRRVLSGEDVPRWFRTEADQDADFNGAVADPEVVAEAWARWRGEVEFAEDFVANAPDLEVTGLRGNGAPMALREVLVHMIEEYARHNGHADFLRERIDGRVGA